MALRKRRQNPIESLQDAETVQTALQNRQPGQGLEKELIIDAKTGQPRQAGTLGEEAQFVLHYRKKAEESLYVFAKTIVGYSLLTAKLHLPFCNYLQKIPPYRKLSLMPRLHYKTTVDKALAIHIFIQPKESNCYYPNGFPHLGHADGRSSRVLFGSTTVDLAKVILGEIALRIETNQKLKALWPQCFWDEPNRQAPSWNKERLTLPRDDIFKEGSMEVTGVDGTKTGFHYDVHIFDDLIDRKARNSVAVMQSAIEWFTASRAFMEDQQITREFTTGTHWAVNDLYTHIQQNDPTVECYVRSIIECPKCGSPAQGRCCGVEPEPIMPERFPREVIEQMKMPPPMGYGVLFPLLYMNLTTDPELVDFDMTQLRYFALEDGFIHFDEEDRDAILHDYLFGTSKDEPMAHPKVFGRFRPSHTPLDDDFDAQSEYFQARYGEN